MFNKALEISLNLAFSRAKEKRHEFITVEHLLLSLLDNPEANQVLIACSGNEERVQQEKLQELRATLSIFIDETTPRISVNKVLEIQPTLGFQRVLQRAVFQVQSAGKDEVNGANILAAIFSEQESHAVYFLSKIEVTRFDVMNYISHGISKLDFKEDNNIDPPFDSSFDSELKPQDGQLSGNLLEQFAVNLNELATLGKIDPLIGRSYEVERAVQVLCRRRKNNPLFVGEAGVGKTAIAEGLAKLILERKVPEPLLGSTIFALDLGILLAGTKYRGDFEKRFKGIIKALQNVPKAILFIDEIHTIVGAGAASGGAVDAANLLKPLLVNGQVRCMGSTTYQEYRNIFEKDRALTRRFQKINVAEPTNEESFNILKGLKSRFENYHHIRYSISALRTAVDLSARYISDRRLPDKAIDVIDEAGARQQLLPIQKRKKVIGKREVEEVVADIVRVPLKHISNSDIDILANLERNLKMLVFGQNRAIETLSAAIKLARSGLREADKPIGSFLLIGPTGVGKTEVTKQLATLMNVKLLRFDMSEYMERHAVSRLIGAPPGYVGYDQGGLLTEEVIKNPHSVVLLDEIEKAHPDIFNLLLQIMDHGTLTDNNGREADFRHIILIMTSNAGAEEMEKTTMGFVSEENSSEATVAIKHIFSPEFRNRLDAVVQFQYLDEEMLDKVVSKFITELEVQLEEKKVSLTVDKIARQWLVEKGTDRKLGARPMARVIQENIKKPLAEELLFGKLVQGGHVNITVKDGELQIVPAPKEKTHLSERVD